MNREELIEVIKDVVEDICKWSRDGLEFNTQVAIIEIRLRAVLGEIRAEEA